MAVQSAAQQAVRKDKGKSIIAFPDEYIVIDIETTGLSPAEDEIIEISAVKYRLGSRTETFTTLVRPRRRVSSFITELTGISNSMLKDAPAITDCIGGFCHFIGDSVLVGHNVNFDVNFLYDNMLKHLGKPMSNSFVDVMRIAKRLLPELPHHRQCDLAEFFSIEQIGAHRALNDCLVCNEVYQSLSRVIRDRGCTLDDFCKNFRNKSFTI